MQTLLTGALYLTIAAHFAFLFFVLLGSVVFLKFPRIRVLHLAITLYGFSISVLQFRCPLTPAENLLRTRIGWPTYTIGFVEYYSEKILAVKITNDLFMAIGVVCFALTLALFFFYRPVWRHRS